MKKIITLAVLALALSASAFATEAQNHFPAQDGGRAQSLDFNGTKPAHIVRSTTATLLHAGAGFLDAICPFGGTLGKYSMAFDTGDSAGFTSGYSILNAAISPSVWTAADSTQNAGGLDGCWVPLKPVKFVLGLYGQQSDAAHSTVYFGHCADGSNPCAF